MIKPQNSLADEVSADADHPVSISTDQAYDSDDCSEAFSISVAVVAVHDATRKKTRRTTRLDRALRKAF